MKNSEGGGSNVLKLILATGSEEINTLIANNLSEPTIMNEVGSKKQLLRQIEEECLYDLVIFSTLLSGDEDIVKTVYSVLNKQDCRLIILAKNPKEPFLEDLFFLGVRDFIFDPINPHFLLERINTPAKFKDAIQIFNNKPSRRFKTFFKDLIKTEYEQKSYLNSDALSMLNGITKLLKLEPKEDINDTFFELEQEITRMVIESDHF